MGTRIHLTRLVALSLTVFALAIPALASASQVPALGTYHATEQDSTPSSPSVTGSSDSGFSWGDAALGASAMLAIGIVAAGGSLYVRSYRHSHGQVRPTS
jgi:hypothetical protein